MTFFSEAYSNGRENDETKRKRRALRKERQETRSKTRVSREETITDDLRMQVISCCAFAQLLEHLVCP